MWVKYVIHFYLYQILKIISLGFLRLNYSNGIHIFYTHIAHLNRDKCPDFGSLGIREGQRLTVSSQRLTASFHRRHYPAHRLQWASRFLSFFLLPYCFRSFIKLQINQLRISPVKRSQRHPHVGHFHSLLEPVYLP